MIVNKRNNQSRHRKRNKVPTIVAREKQVSCSKIQYTNEGINKCCSRCPPGHYLKERCTLLSDTQCLPCDNGTFAAKWNYATTCRRCYPCSQNLVEKEPCSATQATVCGCPDGYVCTQHDALDLCQICEPHIPTVPEPTESPPDMISIWIIVGAALFIVTIIVLVICSKTPLLKNFGRMIKNKSSSEPTPQAETAMAADIKPVGAVHGGPASPLLNDGQIKAPLQEQGKDLNYPIQETDATQIGEFTL
ncbi:tumor necrosis factor receptor superfamily member 3 isoform X2 [Rhinoderma darwinii]|uniref:tumor necrosis factor receptor superfamily member 3 isoform X2 n=1 Tax=Rhinoderma darwinii TaxID=43563 RepID=UPI003F67D6AB